MKWSAPGDNRGVGTFFTPCICTSAVSQAERVGSATGENQRVGSLTGICATQPKMLRKHPVRRGLSESDAFPSAPSNHSACNANLPLFWSISVDPTLNPCLKFDAMARNDRQESAIP
jgi:hypothetical protein